MEKRTCGRLALRCSSWKSGLVVVYVFPLSAEITKKDGQVRFEAQIGRIVVGQTFELSQMEFMGKLEL
jgi:hypothetical protein